MEISRFGSKLAKDIKEGDRIQHPLTRYEFRVATAEIVKNGAYMRLELVGSMRAILVPVNNIIVIL